jgi:hypothetical protein
MDLKRKAKYGVAFLMMVMGFGAGSALSQVARFDSYQLGSIPENANIMVGPFYSDLAMFQSVGIRYIKSSGAGMDYLYGSSAGSGSGATGLGMTPVSSSSSRNQKYGRILKDGLDYPLISQLTARNYLILSKSLSMEVSFALTYRCFPMGSEENTFDVAPGVYAEMGSFTIGASKDAWMGNFNGRNTQASAYGNNQQSGFSANFSTDFELTPYVRGRLYDQPSYRTDYVDSRGYTENLSGQSYPVFQNLLGMDLDWQLAPDKSMGYTFNRIDTLPQDNNYDISRSVVYRQMLEYRQQINPLTAVGARADYYWRDYLQKRGSEFQQDYVGFMNSDLTENTSVNFSLGYSMASLSGAGLYETNGVSNEVIGGFGLQTRLSDSASHGLSYARSQRAGFMAAFELVDAIRYQIQWADPESWAIGFSSTYENVTPKLAATNPYTDWMNQIAASRPLAKDLMLTMTSAYVIRTNGKFLPGQIGEGNLYLSNDYDTWATTVGLIESLTKRLKLYTYVEHMERISSNAQLAGTRNTVGMTLGYYYDF